VCDIFIFVRELDFNLQGNYLSELCEEERGRMEVGGVVVS